MAVNPTDNFTSSSDTLFSLMPPLFCLLSFSRSLYHFSLLLTTQVPADPSIIPAHKCELPTCTCPYSLVLYATEQTTKGITGTRISCRRGWRRFESKGEFRSRAEGSELWTVIFEVWAGWYESWGMGFNSREVGYEFLGWLLVPQPVAAQMWPSKVWVRRAGDFGRQIGVRWVEVFCSSGWSRRRASGRRDKGRRSGDGEGGRRRRRGEGVSHGVKRKRSWWNFEECR